MALAKTFDAVDAEQRLYDAWEKAGCFVAGANAKPGASTYCIMIPPPNVTGALHMGHAFNNTLQDILIRWKRMQGYDTLWQPGTDHAGIATQMVTEREMAANQEPSRSEMGREKFLERVWQQKIKSRGNIIGQLKRLGASCDWTREAFTMSGAPNAPEGEDGNFHDAVIKVFVEMFGKGLIYRGKRLVNWDPHFETAISDLEVENIETQGHMWHFKYPLAGGATYTYVEKDEDGNVLFEEERDFISIATTRPETMLGDGAVAVHPSDQRYASIVGKLCEIPVGPKQCRRQIPIITDDYPDPDFGSGAVKITGAHDFNDYGVAQRGGIPKYRLMDKSGRMRDDGAPYADCAARAQEIAEGADFTEGEIDTLNLVPDDLRGMDRFEARKHVVDQLTHEGLAVMTIATDTRLGAAALKAPVAPEEGGEARSEDQQLVPLVEAKLIMQPYGDRSKVVIEPMLTDQWFVDTDKIVGPALDAVRNGDVKILPERDEKVYFHWLENIEPWCISRQLWWGHQIPVWYGLNMAYMTDNLAEIGLTPDSAAEDWDSADIGAALAFDGLVQEGEHPNCAADFNAVAPLFLNDMVSLPSPLSHARVIEVADKHAAIHALAEGLAQFGTTQDPATLVYPVWRDPDVLDTWFSSGLWPIGTLGWPEQTEELKRYFPTSTLITGTDILFFWVARMMMMQLCVVGQKPFETVYLHGLVRDAKGKKMSKSTGNVVDPLDLIDEYGADALRFTNAAMASLGGALKLDTQRIAGYRNFGTKLWNACRFAEMNNVYTSRSEAVQKWCAGEAQGVPPRAAVNKWIIGETAKVREEVDQAFADFRFNDAANALYAFVWGKVCDWYIEFSKPLFDGDQADETRAVMAWVLDQCLILLHPIMPFVTEELWGTLAPRDTMLVVADWPTYLVADLVDPAADAELNWVVDLIEAIRSARAQMHVPAGAKIPMVVKGMKDEAQVAWSANEAMIKRLARIDSFGQVDDFPKGTVTLGVAGGQFGLPLADVIDITEEKARLEKSLSKLAKELGGLRGRLNNPKFALSAPEEVVEETRANLAAREDEEAKLKEALVRLSEIG